MPAAHRAGPSRKDTARISIRLPSISAYAATGLWQPPPIACKNVRSAVTQWNALQWFSRSQI
ncbi:MAG TPA: hypothetical protein VMB80_07045 [Candidatus Acidoferrum sp.]|nr:hypothetical protein [Candidatus Acidoferrum sp.]